MESNESRSRETSSIRCACSGHTRDEDDLSHLIDGSEKDSRPAGTWPVRDTTPCKKKKGPAKELSLTCISS